MLAKRGNPVPHHRGKLLSLAMPALDAAGVKNSKAHLQSITVEEENAPSF